MDTRCAIAGGGPAGIMLGFLLARAGIDVVVLEKWRDFLRDFRGDTIHPSTMQLMHELGLLDDFLKLPHSETKQIHAFIGGEDQMVADFTHLPVRCPFVAFVPQWDFLNFMADRAAAYPSFHLLMETEAVDLIQNNGRVAGLKTKSPAGQSEISAELVVGADGRHSTIRERSELQVADLGAPIDVLWFRVSQREGDPRQSLGRIDRGKMLVMLDRSDYWQCAFLIHKGDFDHIKQRGLDAFREDIAQVAPFLRERTGEIADWDAVKLLTVQVNRLQRWYRDGLLCIGDAAHAMSPVGGVGINLAVQDAVAAANILIPRFRQGRISLSDLDAVQRRREMPARWTQAVQVFVQNRIISPVLSGDVRPSVPWPLKLGQRFPVLARVPARMIGIGFRPEHIAA
jgi:2-polyprenyl-6-methoxyphenol hydroxylase-like FAD-dependent oxidoreductase